MDGEGIWLRKPPKVPGVLGVRHRVGHRLVLEVDLEVPGLFHYLFNFHRSVKIDFSVKKHLTFVSLNHMFSPKGENCEKQ